LFTNIGTTASKKSTTAPKTERVARKTAPKAEKQPTARKTAPKAEKRTFVDRLISEGTAMFGQSKTELDKVISGAPDAARSSSVEESKDATMDDQRDNLKRSHSFNDNLENEMMDNL